MIVLKKIRDKRKVRGFSQKKMAELLNISQPGYQKIEQGTNVLSIERFLEICRILEIDSYNELLPAVNAEIVAEIEKVLLAGSMAFDNIRNNANYSRRLLDELIEKIKIGNIEKEALIDELRFIDNYLSIVGKDSFNQEYQFNSLRQLLEKID
ncbi:MAG: helix-turn-helix domain-containing protein [Mariniphaga sp.]|nr:helix-turn-helix domain-containing protein [Mariniphaga sp.]